MELVLLIWLLCGAIAATVAANKGRNALGWFLMGMIFGPLGFILALVVAPNVAKVEDEKIRRGESRRCPHCAEAIKREAAVCKHCGRDVAADGVQPEPQA